MRSEVGVVSRRPSLFFREIDLLAMWQIRPQLGRLLGIEFVRFRDLLIDDVRIAVVSTSAWLMPTESFQIPGLSQEPRRQTMAEVAEPEILDLGLRSDALHRVSRLMPSSILPISLV
ncbi:hypothetical protein [Sinorhizobium meliloti]|uniref:hypothetical protein n=1 Tax=Rhizobium meliloti TaxID=382 RepID=UPI0013E3F281|nr:hypothetical protein [Sinorhizobium meliloti]